MKVDWGWLRFENFFEDLGIRTADEARMILLDESVEIKKWIQERLPDNSFDIIADWEDIPPEYHGLSLVKGLVTCSELKPPIENTMFLADIYLYWQDNVKAATQEWLDSVWPVAKRFYSFLDRVMAETHEDSIHAVVENIKESGMAYYKMDVNDLKKSLFANYRELYRDFVPLLNEWEQVVDIFNGKFFRGGEDD